MQLEGKLFAFVVRIRSLQNKHPKFVTIMFSATQRHKAFDRSSTLKLREKFDSCSDNVPKSETFFALVYHWQGEANTTNAVSNTSGMSSCV